MRLFQFILFVASLTFTAGCNGETAEFEFIHASDSGEATYVATASDPALIAVARAELAKAPRERALHINGPIALGDGGHNQPWSWHFLPNQWQLANISMEVCDAQPSYVEGNLDEWLAKVGRYCPWASRISREK